MLHREMSCRGILQVQICRRFSILEVYLYQINGVVFSLDFRQVEKGVQDLE